jgi:hypothetical protein
MKQDVFGVKNGKSWRMGACKDSLFCTPQPSKKQRKYSRKRTLLSWLLTFAMMWSVFGLSTGVASADPSGAIWGESPIAEPYPYVGSGNPGGFTGESQPASPDPLVSYRWDDPQASDGLEIFLRKPVAVDSETPENFSGMQTLKDENASVHVTGD